MTLSENIKALMRAAPALGEDVAAELIIAAVEAESIRRKSDKAASAGRSGAAKRWGANGTPMAPHKGANSPPQLPTVVEESGSDLGSDPDPESDPDPDPEYCAELSPFPIVGKGGPEWRATQQTVADIAAAFPAVDVVAEMRKAGGWLAANAPKRKTGKGMPRFLYNWVARAAERGTAATKNGHSNGAPRPPGFCDFHKSPYTAGKPSKYPKPATCSECKHVAARSRPRTEGEPTSLASVMGES